MRMNQTVVSSMVVSRLAVVSRRRRAGVVGAGVGRGRAARLERVGAAADVGEQQLDLDDREDAVEQGEGDQRGRAPRRC